MRGGCRRCRPLGAGGVSQIGQCPDMQHAGRRVRFESTRQVGGAVMAARSEEHTSELQSLMRTSYAVFRLKKKIIHNYVLPLTSILHLETHYSITTLIHLS